MSDGGTIERVYLVTCRCGAHSHNARIKKAEAIQDFIADGWSEVNKRWTCRDCKEALDHIDAGCT